MNNDSYASRRDQSDKHLPQAKTILAKVFGTSFNQIEIAPDNIDKEEATDLLLPDGKRVAFRTRNTEYLSRYPNDITIRLKRTFGESEWTKIQAGRVDYMLYGFVDCDGLVDWTLLNLSELLDAVRWDWDRLRLCRKHEPPGQEPFMSVDLSRLNSYARSSIILAQGGEE